MKILNTSLLILLSATYALSECSEADKKALEAFDRAWTAAGQNGDRAALTAIYADDYVGMPAAVSKTRAIEATMTTFERNKVTPPTSTSTADHFVVHCSPASATITHRNTTVSGTGTTTYSRSVHILEKRGGKWQVVSNAGHSLDDGQIIWYLEQDWNNSLMKRDRAWFEKNYANDFSGVDTMTGRLSNKAEDIAGILGDRGLEIAETSDMNIRVDGDRAVVTGIFRTRGKDEKDVAYDRRARFTDTWIKRDGRWQAWASQGTLIR